MRLTLTTLISIFLLTHCVPNREDSATVEDLPDAVMNRSAMPTDDQIENRVSAAQERLNATDGGQRIWQAMEAHGGLARWYRNGPLAFQFNYQPLNDGIPRNTYQVANYWTSQTRHQLVEDTTIQYGWDGEQAWAYPSDTLMPYNVRFWSLTPYYFVGIPFVLGDEGINLELTGEDSWEDQVYELVKVTYDQGVGDAPDDYYIIYIHPTTHRVGAIRYVVSYPAYFSEGKHSPEKLMAYDDAQTVEGIHLPQRYRTFMWEDGQVGDHVTDITLSRVSFRPDLASDYFEPPTQATIIKEL